MIENINDGNFEEKILGEKLVVVDFWAEWCGPCKMLAPILTQLEEEFSGTVEFKKINVDENTKVSTDYSIMSIPTLKMFKNGKEVDTIIGLISKEQIKSRIKNVI